MPSKKLTQQEIEEVFKPLILKEIERLEAEIKRLSGDTVVEEDGPSVYTVHVADVSGDLYEREFSAGILSKEYETLSALKYALEKIEHGTYGICESCGKPIPKGRLKIMPYAVLCVKCEEMKQKENNDQSKKWL